MRVLQPDVLDAVYILDEAFFERIAMCDTVDQVLKVLKEKERHAKRIRELCNTVLFKKAFASNDVDTFMDYISELL